MKGTGFPVVGAVSLAALFVVACATERPDHPLDTYIEIDATTILAAPDPVPGQFSPANRDLVARGKYMVELLGCGACHTEGALAGDPDFDRSLAGSQTGIAYANPLGDELPGVVYPPNITPDPGTGIGNWSDAQIASAIRAGIGRHGSRRIASMPWPAYTKMYDDDVSAIVSYLRSIKPVVHQVPGRVEPGHRAKHPFVYFGVYRSRP